MLTRQAKFLQQKLSTATRQLNSMVGGVLLIIPKENQFPFKDLASLKLLAQETNDAREAYDTKIIALQARGYDHKERNAHSSAIVTCLHRSQDMKPQVMTSFLSISILGLGMQILSSY
ncbi:hypothetical protein POTOM_030661 [Populus tomentosa]|uniref:Uncharacterized protein n=1 Tax=Populus tomentosa TaxID=118781 RepID=A0A8X7Z934_POPTO|nr:hypothetical protein POTOM_030661 [Populus tomentosa]